MLVTLKFAANGAAESAPNYPANLFIITVLSSVCTCSFVTEMKLKH